MKRLLTALLAAVLCFAVTSTASAEYAPIIVTKTAKWVTWGPLGPAGTPSDTSANMSTAGAIDTTAAIYIGDMAFGSTGLTVGPGAFTAMNAIAVWLTSDGSNDNVDSVYYVIEKSIDGIHWVANVAAEEAKFTGALCGWDQGAGTAGANVVSSGLAFWVKVDADLIDGGAASTSAAPTAWQFAPYIRFKIKSDIAGTAWTYNAMKLHVSYPGYKEVH